jgi:murein DD-endopeptidase MepM/ murein hydrolase activator NlpD
MRTTNVESGRVDDADTEATKRFDDEWTHLHENLGRHAQHEDTIIFPLLQLRAPGEADQLGHDHELIHDVEEQMTGLLDRLEAESDPSVRRLFGREFHRSMQQFTAMCLSHFDDEERHLMPRLGALYDDDALEAAFGQILATVGPDERDYTMVHMRDSLDPEELDELKARSATRSDEQRAPEVRGARQRGETAATVIQAPMNVSARRRGPGPKRGRLSASLWTWGPGGGRHARAEGGLWAHRADDVDDGGARRACLRRSRRARPGADHRAVDRSADEHRSTEHERATDEHCATDEYGACGRSEQHDRAAGRPHHLHLDADDGHHHHHPHHPPMVDLEFLIPRPEFGALSGHQRDLVDQLHRATFTYALRRLAFLDTARQVAAAKDILAKARAAESDAIADEILTLAESGSDDTIAEVHALKRKLDAAVRRPHTARVSAQNALDAVDAQADSQRGAAAAALADRSDAEQGLQTELGPDAVRAKPDDVTDLLTKVQDGQADAADAAVLAWPIPGAPMASPFGLRNDPLSNGAGFHPGVDLSASSGTEVHAAAAGRVVRAGSCGGYGLCVVIDHGSNVATLYGHLSQVDVSVGNAVDAGDVIGLVGSTGLSTGAHLHFEVRIHGLPTDPVLSLGTGD